MIIARLIAVLAVTALVGRAQFGDRKMALERMLPPAVELDARSVSISASSQDQAGREVAASFKEMFRGKIQGDSRFPIKDSDPDLRISIVVTRYYVEPKQLTRTGKNATNCRKHLAFL